MKVLTETAKSLVTVLGSATHVMPLKITLNRPYLSIGTLICSELPDFAVLTGRNGAGKTQLLGALSTGHAAVAGIEHHEIELYDMASFCPSDSTPGKWHSNQFARTTARDYVDGDQEPSPVTVALEIFQHHTAEIERQNGKDARHEFVTNLRHRIERTPDFNVFPADSARDFDYDRAVKERVMVPLAQRADRRAGSRQSRGNSFNENPAALVTMAMKRTGKLPHELTYDDIMRASHYEGGTIANTISEVFAAYKVDQYDWAHARFESDTGPVRFADLVAEFHERNPPPWETLRDVMAKMRDAAGAGGLFDFDFSDPADVHLDMSNYREFSFKTEMTNRTSGARYKPNALSSGEKVLMALCLASFNQRLGRRRPRLLLLDELDAVLHPSMVTALVAALKSLFLDHGCRVLMTTHSPMTVAALPENNVYRVIRKGAQVRLTPTTTTEAVEELSEGIATVDTGLRIAAFDQTEVTILTEGHNARHLKRWVELNFPQRVHVFDKLAQHTDKGQLLTYGRMLAAMDPATHFVIVWDCDAKKQAQTLREEIRSGANVTPFAFKRRDNEVARNGIENNYDEDILSPYTLSKIDNRDGRVLRREFNPRRKTEFADHVWHRGTNAYFAHFGDLHAVVAGVLSSGSGPLRPTKADSRLDSVESLSE